MVGPYSHLVTSGIAGSDMVSLPGGYLLLEWIHASSLFTFIQITYVVLTSARVKLIKQ